MFVSNGTPLGKPPDPQPMDDDGFKKPAPRKRGRPKKNHNEDAASVSSVATNNTYESLTDNDEGNGEPTAKKYRKPRAKKPPPIVLPFVNSKNEIDNTLKDVPIDASKLFRRVTKDGTKIFVPSTDDFKALRSHLENKKTKFTTFTLHDDMMVRYVMYGLPEYDLDEVQIALHNTLKVNPVVVKKMKINKKSYSDQCNYLLYFKKTSGITLMSLKCITGILGYHVHFAKYQKGPHPTQCYNCQQFSHASSNCRLDPRCMRCSGPHKSNLCPLLSKETRKIPDDEVKCINCGGQHTSNKKDCPALVRLMKQKEELKNRLKATRKEQRYVSQRKTNFNYHYPPLENENEIITTSVPVVSTFNGKPWSETLQNAAPSNNSMSNNNKFSAGQLFEIFNEMVRICETCRTKTEQLRALTAVFEKYVHYD